jgi:hypothetical protein
LNAIGVDAKDAFPELMKALKDEEIAVRVAAIEALGSIGAGAKGAVPSLIVFRVRPANRVAGARGSPAGCATPLVTVEGQQAELGTDEELTVAAAPLGVAG